ncbi:MAG: DegT/DnrJ/EryC1/StrS family aminotransferase [Solirubrobacterales bacterium]|nr:DegT/DnrJ/EryC1/StrS family aminotransferase [Solirubrobacterales bacterium]
MAELRGAFDRVVGASSFILGEEVERFEQEFATYCGAPDCIGVASGTAALTLALLAAGIGRGDEVIVPAHTFIASALGILHAGATPVFCDVEAATGLIDPASAASVVTDRTAAVIPVHLYGQVCDMDAIGSLADRHDLLILEDAAQAHGATWRGSRAGSLGAVAAFSFYPSKNLGALGDGGAICTRDPELAARARQLRHLGQRGKGEHVLAGFNERLDALQAALLRVKLPHLDGFNARRRQAASVYRGALEGEVGLLHERSESPCIYHLFPIRVADRRRLMDDLAAEGVACQVHYSPAVHEQPPFAGRRRDSADLEQATRWAREELSLPIFPELELAEAQRVAAACRAAVRARSSSLTV